MNGSPSDSISPQAFNLALKIAANIPGALTEREVEYFQNNLDAIPDALERGFTIPEKAGLLMPIATTDVDGGSIAYRCRFRKEEEADEVKIRSVGPHFREHFLGKVERRVSPATLDVHELQEHACCSTIMSALTGRKVENVDDLQAVAGGVESSLTHLWALLHAQGFGNSDGPLLVNGDLNIFNIRDSENTLRVVAVAWSVAEGGWYIDSLPLSISYHWSFGSRVFSGNS
jgi:hypothetical protein